MKKFFGWIVKLAIIGVALLVIGLVVLRLMFPPEKIKQLALAYAQDTLHREIRFDTLSFNLIGFTLDNFSLSEENSFEQGAFLQAKQLHAKVALWPLFQKRIEIKSLILDSLTVNLIKGKNGSFNFSTLLSSSENPPSTQESETISAATAPFVLTADQLTATHCNVRYQDLQTGLSAGLDELNLHISNFALNHPFTTQLSFVSKTQEHSGPTVNIPVKTSFTTDLASLNLEQAHAEISHFQATYKNVTFLLNGQIHNFQDPAADLTGTLTGIDQHMLTDWLPDLPSFSLPKIELALQAQVNLEKSKAMIEQASLRILDNALNVNGETSWGEKVSYRLKGDLQADLAQIVQMANSAEFHPQGKLKASLFATDKKEGKDVSGTLILKDVSALYPPFTLTQTNGQIKIISLDEITGTDLNGLLNGEKFTTSFAYKNKSDVSDFSVKLDLDKLTLEQFPGTSSSAQKETKSNDPDASPSDQKASLFNLNADITIGEVNIPYFRTQGLALQTDLQNVSQSLAQTNGTVSFSLQPGAITDMDKLVKQNKIVQIILLPLKLLDSVGKKLDLNLFGGEKSQTKRDEIALTKGEGHYTFTDGIMRIDSTTFESALTNLNATGTIDFAADKLNMKASATLVTKQTPVVFKITGTLDNPSGKLDVTNTLGSVLGGLLKYKASKNTVPETDTPADSQTQENATAENSSTHETAVSTDSPATEQQADLKETAQEVKAAAKALKNLFKKNTDSSAD